MHRDKVEELKQVLQGKKDLEQNRSEGELSGQSTAGFAPKSGDTPSELPTPSPPHRSKACGEAQIGGRALSPPNTPHRKSLSFLHEVTEEESILQKTEEKIAYLEEELKLAKDQAKESQDRYIRLYAEFENFRKRALKEREETKNYAQEQLILDLLPVLDDLERTLTHAKEKADLNTLIEGVKMVKKQMFSILAKFGLTVFDSKGELFDPHLHEAVTHQETSEHLPDTVMAEYRKGYKLNGKLVRPAMVAVAKEPKLTQ